MPRLPVNVALPVALDRALAEGLVALRLAVVSLRIGCEATSWLDAVLLELADGADDVVFAVANGRTVIDLPGRPVATCQ